MRFAYADPPYLGLAEKFYGDRHPEAAAYDRIETHAALIAQLCADFDGWAMSLHTPSLRAILPLCPEDTRVGAWVKPFASFKPGVNPAYAWEPILFRAIEGRDRSEMTVRDWVSCPITLRRGLVGAKPEAVCFWLFELLGMKQDDDLADLFPGSGAVTRALDSWRRQKRFA